ncbi:DNA topoisomerase 2-binding protein 1 [Podila horticola]|nr:DNA topoisomerase 2-binding protein 1 [Podila horticola]
MFRQSSTKKSTAPLPQRPRNAPPQDQSQPLNSTQPLKSFKISFTGLKIDERSVASTMIQELGGESNVTLTEDVTHLIARSEGSQKYRVALKLRIPVLALEWINELHDQWKNKGVLDMKALHEKHAMGPLKGCSVCVTGFDGDLKKEIEDFTLQFGGTYNMDMIKGTTTHLICEKPTGKKFTTAKDWGITCVPFQWLEDMKEKQERPDCSLYTISPQGYKRRFPRKLSLPDSLEEEDTADLQSGSNSDQFLESCCIYLCKSFRPEMATRLKKMVLTGGGVFVQEYQPTSVTHVVVPSNSLDPQTLALFENTADIPYVVDVQWLGGSAKAKKALPESDYIVPFPARTEDGVAGSRTEESLLWTTDAVLNPDRQKGSKMATIRSKPKPLKSVPPDTYREHNPSSVAPSPAGTAIVLTPELPSLSAPRLLRSRTESKVLAEALGDLSMTGTGGDLLSTQRGANNFKIDLSVLEEEFQEEEGQQGPISNIFLGLNITAFGCKKKKTERIKQGTVVYGGTYYDAGMIPSGLENTMLTVIPLTSPLSSIQHLKGVVLTDLWFERSVEEDRAITNYQYFMYKPLKTIPIPGFSDLKISMSTGSVTEIEYRQTARLIKALGGEFHDNLNTITTNLLISDNAAGAKFNFMLQNNRPIVKMDWLKDCVEKGERLPFKAYFPDHISDTPVKNEPVIKTEMPSQYGSQSQYLAQTLEFQNADKTQVPSDTPLDGCTVCVPTRIQGNHKELCDLVQELGGRLLTAYHHSATHLIQKGKADRIATKEIRIAQRERKHVVCPTWLYRCKESGTLVNEASYPPVFDEFSAAIVQTGPTTRSAVPKKSPAPTRLGASKSTGNINSGRSGIPPTRRSATVGSISGHSEPFSQTFQGTAAGATSAMFTDSASSSVAMSYPSINASFETYDQSMQETSPPEDDDGVWRPLPHVPAPRVAKRRRAAPVEESPTTDCTVTSNGSATETESFDTTSLPDVLFDKAEKYDEDTVYWDDVDGREKKRAFLESLGYKVQSRDPKSDITEEPPQLYFLITGVQERQRYYDMIKDLGGICLELETMDDEVWKQKCTHLITNGKNPPRTAKLVAAQHGGAYIVTKTFVTDSAAKGAFVDEGPYHVN